MPWELNMPWHNTVTTDERDPLPVGDRTSPWVSAIPGTPDVPAAYRHLVP